MPRLTRLLALTRLTWLPWTALPREEETDPLAGPPLDAAQVAAWLGVEL